MDLEQFTQLATSTAVYLTRQRQGEWTVTEITELHPGYPQALLAGPDHAQLKIKHGWGAAGKVTVYGMMPSKYGYDRYEYAKHANVAPERGAKTIANEARRRVLDAGYLAELPQRVYAWETELAEAGVRAGIMARAAGLFGLPTPGDAPLNLSRFLPNRRGQVELSSDGLPQMSIELHGLDPDVGLRMLQALSSSFMVSGSCCRKFGPGHHPQFEVAGCLRERRNGDEHDWASRRWVRELLTSHGIGAEEADRALDDAQASRYQVAEVYDGGKILAIVSWDHDGCGEYTVELAGKDKPAQLSYDESEALFDAWREKSEGKNWADYYAGTDIHPAWR